MSCVGGGRGIGPQSLVGTTMWWHFKYTFTVPRRDASGLCQKFPCPPIRGRREYRVHAAPAVSCAKLHKKTHTSIQVQRRQSGIPCAMVLTAYFVLPGDRAFLSPSSCGVASARLDASVETSGPHDFAVRMQSALVSCAACVHRISPRICDDHDTPLGGVRRRRFRFDLGARSTTKTATHWHDGQNHDAGCRKTHHLYQMQRWVVYHRARIRATRWLNSSCALLNMIRRAGRRESAARSMKPPKMR
jgi:hypothetical protein